MATRNKRNNTSETSVEVAPVSMEKEIEAATIIQKQAKTEIKEHEPNDLIPCRSITQGELLLSGKRSGILYRWFNVGDVVDVEFQDLNALNASRSKYLYEAYFVVEDNSLLEHPRWKGLSDVYEALYNTQDIDAILDLQPAQLKQMLTQFPKSYQNTLAIEVSTRIENGNYDSISRIKVFDEVLGTDLMVMVR